MNDEPKPTESQPEAPSDKAPEAAMPEAEASAETAAEDETAPQGEAGSDAEPSATKPKRKRRSTPTPYQRAWLERGLEAPKGKLPMFDLEGGEIDPRCIQACLESGWAEAWFANPLNPAVQICRITDKGRAVTQKPAESEPDESDIKD